MLDIRAIRRDPDAFAQRLARRGSDVSLDPLLELDTQRRDLIGRADALRHDKSVTEKGMRSADKSSPEFAAFRDQMRAVAGSALGAQWPIRFGLDWTGIL